MSNSRVALPRETVLLVGAAVAVGTIIFTTLWWSSSRSSTTRRVVDTTRAPSIESTRRGEVPPYLWRSFEEAAYSIRVLTPPKRLSNGDRLLLYSLYKHIVEGDAPETTTPSSSVSSWNIMAQHAKHQAWIRMRGMPLRTAIEHYTSAVHHFVSAPTTTTATEGDDDDDDDDDETHGLLGPSAVSRPMAENGDSQQDADASDEQKQLMQAARYNNVSALIRLLSSSSSDAATQSGALITYADASGQTALHLAADQGATECIAALVAAGAHVNAVDADGISVLQAAVIAGHVDTVAWLLRHGADAQLPDADGDTPLSCAQDDPDNNSAMMQVFAEYIT